jgi:hypothetical protein
MCPAASHNIGHSAVSTGEVASSGVRRQRADADGADLGRDALQLGNAADVDERRRSGQPELEQRDQAVAAGQELRARVRCMSASASRTAPAR